MEDAVRWKQFLTPVKSFDANEAREYMADKSPEAYTLLDVRQLGEYEAGHLPGGKLIPLPELGERLGEIDPDKPAIIY